MPVISKETAQRYLDMWLEAIDRAELPDRADGLDPRQPETDPGKHCFLGKESG